jgi:parvulin-like peptidyl-prolyl isomerase
MEFRSGVQERSPSISALQQDLARIDRAIDEQQQRWLQRQRDAEAVFAIVEARLNSLSASLPTGQAPKPVQSSWPEQARQEPAPLALPEGLDEPEAELVNWLERQGTSSAHENLPAVLAQYPALRDAVRVRLRARLASEVVIDAQDWSPMAAELWQGLPGQPPRDPNSGWIEAVPLALRSMLEERWLHLRLQRWCDLHYGDRILAYFQESSAALEKVVFSMIRVESHGTALELYLRLLDEGASFHDLARQFATGDERLSLGVIGPRRLAGLHPDLQAALSRMALGELHEPLRIDDWFVLLRLESRIPAQFDQDTRQQLLQEMLDHDLDAVLTGRQPPFAAHLKAVQPQRLFPES